MIVKLIILKTGNASVCKKDFLSGNQINLSDSSSQCECHRYSHSKVPFPVSVPICASGSTQELISVVFATLQKAADGHFIIVINTALKIALYNLRPKCVKLDNFTLEIWWTVNTRSVNSFIFINVFNMIYFQKLIHFNFSNFELKY